MQSCQGAQSHVMPVVAGGRVGERASAYMSPVHPSIEVLSPGLLMSCHASSWVSAAAGNLHFLSRHNKRRPSTATSCTQGRHSHVRKGQSSAAELKMP